MADALRRLPRFAGLSDEQFESVLVGEEVWLEPDAFWRMLSVCPSILRNLVSTLADRFQKLGEVSQEYARLISLGTMAAGLAHELNKPAIAERRAVDGLRESFEESQSFGFKLQEDGSISLECLAEIGREGHRLNDGVEATREYDLNLPRIDAYGSELNQIWTALLDNALDATRETTREGPAQVKMRTAHEDGRVLAEISKDGPGVPEELRDRIFELFFTPKEVVTTKEVGSGVNLGLDIARRVVDRLGEDIRAVSELNGSRIEVRLPVESAG